jgi:alpha-galactosidase/6-phospho-beta-glucosidase family protein
MGEDMAARITIIGGGSYQWAPKLLVDFANTPLLHDAEIVLEDVDPAPLPRMVELVEHIADVRGIGMTATSTTDQRRALEGADYVVVNISTGGFDSMRHDLTVPARHGVVQSVGDSVGPGGINRALRNIPVFLELARDMENVCPDAWLFNLTNPMTTICRAVTRETSVKTLGLCHEITGAQFALSQLLDANFFEISPTVAGVNHLPFITALDVGGTDGLERLREVLDAADPEKADLVRQHRVKFELFSRFGVLPGAGDRHVVEFFSGFLTEESGWGDRWGVHLTTIEERELGQAHHIRQFEEMLTAPAVSEWPSGEMVAPVITCFELDQPGWFPLNIPNDGHVADLPPDVVVEGMCVADGDGVRGRDEVRLPPAMAETLHRVSASQELTVEAAVRGSRDKVVEAMLVDPLAGRIDFDELGAMTDELLDATRRWLPQFALA